MMDSLALGGSQAWGCPVPTHGSLAEGDWVHELSSPGVGAGREGNCRGWTCSGVTRDWTSDPSPGRRELWKGRGLGAHSQQMCKPLR